MDGPGSLMNCYIGKLNSLPRTVICFNWNKSRACTYTLGPPFSISNLGNLNNQLLQFHNLIMFSMMD